MNNAVNCKDLKLGILAGGNLGFECIKYLYENYKIEFVFCDSKSKDIIELSLKYEIPLFTGNPRTKDYKKLINNTYIDVLLSINYLFLIDLELINHPRRYAINIHGSLLPKYRGRTPHVWAVINNEEETGITAHLIDSGCDTGPIIKQVRIPIDPNETGADILKKYELKYPDFVNSILFDIQTENVNPIPQESNTGSFFGKRTPEDGKINWNWQKERIHNWIRAQAHPYPGAFCFFKNNKITIHKVSYSDLYFSFQQENGLVLETNPLTIKTPNGALQIWEYNHNANFLPKKGDIWS